MSTYLGNASLSTAVKERVLSTFQQTLALYKQGRTEEVVQGCGLILRMDPMFDPAKKLLEKAQNPAAAVDLDSLVRPPTPADALSEARAAMAQRDFQRVINLTTEILTNDLMNEDARLLNEKARERMEAVPFIEQFARKIDQAVASGNAASARGDLDKIRALDPEHPALARLEQAIGQASAPAKSFVVESPAQPSGRGSTQASDFGFTFEEEKQQQQQQPASPFSTDTGTTAPVKPPSGFSFDSPAIPPKGFSFDTPVPQPSPFGSFSFDSPSSPAEPAKASASSEFDFATASIETTPDDQKKIQQYIADGDRAFEAGNFQQAIDLWSRVFLIDVTNEDASSRIETAKSKRRDTEQKIEAAMAAGMQALSRKDKATARERFTEVLRLDPGNTTAHEYLDAIGGPVKAAAAPAAPAIDKAFVPATPPPPPPGPSDVFTEDIASEGTYEAPQLPPIPAPSPRKAAPVAVKGAKPSRGAPIGAIAVVLVVAVLGFGGWFVWTKWFNKPKANPDATQTILVQATTLSQEGQYDRAIALLQDVKPDDPQHDKALSMIADLQRKKGQASEMVDGRPAGAVYQEGLAAGKAAFDARDYAAAKKAFDSAARVKPLPPDMKAMYDIASQQVGKLASANSLFSEGRYQDAIGNLETLLQQDPQNASMKRMITDAHFNLGATALQEERLPDAMKEFDEVLKRDPADELAKRSKLLAERYNGQPKDLLYKIYVKYLPLRKVS